MIRSISEILKEISALEKKEDRIQALIKYNTLSLRTLLVYALDKRVVWLLPDSDPPYKPSDYPDTHSALHFETKKFHVFCEGGANNLSQHKREKLFIQLLESVHPDDAKLMLAVIRKSIPYKGISVKLINEALGDIIEV